MAMQMVLMRMVQRTLILLQVQTSAHHRRMKGEVLLTLQLELVPLKY